MTHTPYLSLVIPVYNEHASLSILQDKLRTVCEMHSYRYEIIYVDDGSTDGSKEILEQFANNTSNTRVAIQRKNFGKTKALMVGFALADGDYIITLDADLQDDPDEIPNLIAKLYEGFDLVIGWKHNRQDPKGKTIPSRIANTVVRKTTGLNIHDMNSGLKIYSKRCAKSLRIHSDLHRFIPILAHLEGYRVTEIPVTHHPRQFGESKYGASRLFRGGFDFITTWFMSQYGTRPMHFFGTIGLIIMSIGMLINISLTVEWFYGVRPIGNRPLLLLGTLMLVMGTQFLTIGLVAEMIVTLMQRQRDPLSSVYEFHNLKENSSDD